MTVGAPGAGDLSSAASVVVGGTDVLRGRRASLAGYLGLPIVLLIVVAALVLWLSTQELDSIEQRVLNAPIIWSSFVEHMVLSFVSTFFVVLIAVPVGVLLTRPFARPIVPPVIALANIGQAVPSIGVLVLLALIWTIGFRPAIVALVAYSILPVLRNTMVGLQQVDQTIIEAGRGMGMTRAAVLGRIEMPLAVPVILAGIRTALVINVGTATLATFINAGGLGEIISRGISTNRVSVTLTGSVLTAVVALFIDHLGGIAESRLSPKGL